MIAQLAITCKHFPAADISNLRRHGFKTYTLSSRNKFKTKADASVNLYIQNASPGKAKESNWLPAPDGPIYLVMRLYWPKTEPPSMLPPGDGTWKPPAVTQVQ